MLGRLLFFFDWNPQTLLQIMENLIALQEQGPAREWADLGETSTLM